MFTVIGCKASILTLNRTTNCVIFKSQKELVGNIRVWTVDSKEYICSVI